MIPLKLQIKNFLSYGAEIQTIDFSHYPLICFSGKNGHGKSALLDAITWAIWGQARKIGMSSKADQGLLHLGQHSMMVIIDFVCNGTTYRIRREYSNNFGKPYAVLEFGVLQEDTSTIIPLTDKTIRATQEKIENTLHLDFDTFINSAFLRQGQSNEFSKKSPKERKDIIASILGLNHYESIRKLATEKIKQASTEKTTLLAFKQKYEQELDALTRITEQIAQVNEKLVIINQKELMRGREQSEHEKKLQQLMQEQNSYELISLKQEQINKQEQDDLTRLRATRVQWRTVRKAQKDAPDYASLEKEKQQLSAQLQTLQTKVQKLLLLKEEHLQTKTALATVEQQLRLEHAQRAQQLQMNLAKLKTELATTQKAYARAQEAETVLFKEQQQLIDKSRLLTEELQNYATQLASKSIIEKLFERRKEYYHKFIAQGNSLRTQLAELDQKQGLVHDDDNPSCPLCEQNLSASRKKFLKGKFADEKQVIVHRIARLSVILPKLKELTVANHTQLESYKQIENRATAAHATVQEIDKQLIVLHKKITECKEELIAVTATGKHIAATLADEEKKIAELGIFDEKVLKNNADYAALIQRLSEQESQTKDLPILMQEQQHVHGIIQTREDQLRTYQALKEQLHLQEQRVHEIKNVIKSVKQIRSQATLLQTEAQKYAHLGQSLRELQAQLQTIRTTMQELATEKNQALEQKGSLEAQKTSLLQLEQEYKAQQKKIIELNQIIDDYTIIAQSTGKDGIQALLIEDAIPEIEQEANSLLGKLTDNQAHLSIESLRDLKKGGTRETLDIKISDAVGIRPYELFSGGEAFRIDFALRIAISKLLARRAGTALQTLIIDEGFGSQDEEGLAHIMEAIYKIQEDFERIIIVSHLPSMKEQFPVHFVIEKSSQGSVVKVVEQE